MNLETIKKNLSTKLDPTPNFTTENKLASVLIVIYDYEPKILKKSLDFFRKPSFFKGLFIILRNHNRHRRFR